MPQRSASRFLYIPAPDTELFEDKIFSGLPSLLRAGDLLVFNDSRVFPARLYGPKTSGGQLEILIERRRQRIDIEKLPCRLRLEGAPINC